MTTTTLVSPGNRRLTEAKIGDARTRGKHEAVKDFDDCDDAADVDAMIQHAKEQMEAASTSISRAYWVAYWARMVALERRARA